MSQSPIQIARENNWLAREIARPALTSSGPLAGMTFFAKDLFAIAGEVTRAGSACFDEDPPAIEDAVLVRRAREAGATLLGTTNMDALAYGFVTNNPEYGRARHPMDPRRLCGGSSGGSAAVVAAGLADFALGTDTSGSIRVPAAFCGVAGYKPSVGMLENSGIQQLSPTFDRPGVLARDLATLRQVAQAIGHHSLSETDDGLPGNALRGKVGLLGGHFQRGIDPAVEQAVLQFSIQLGARTGVEISGATAARAAAYVLVAYEAFQVHAKRLRESPDAFDAETRHRLFDSALISEEWRANAIAVQTDFSHRFNMLFDEFSFLVSPCVPMLPPLKSELDTARPGQTPLRASLGLYTQPISLVGCPVVSVPLSTKAGWPTAIQLIGPVGSDTRLLEYAESLSS